MISCEDKVVVQTTKTHKGLEV